MLTSALLLQLVSILVSMARQPTVLGLFDTNIDLGFRVPPGGLEPPTVGLKVRCSAIELGGRVSTSLRDAGGVPQQSDSMGAARESPGSNPLVQEIPCFGGSARAHLSGRKQ